VVQGVVSVAKCQPPNSEIQAAYYEEAKKTIKKTRQRNRPPGGKKLKNRGNLRLSSTPAKTSETGGAGVRKRTT